MVLSYFWEYSSLSTLVVLIQVRFAASDFLQLKIIGHNLPKILISTPKVLTRWPLVVILKMHFFFHIHFTNWYLIILYTSCETDLKWVPQNPTDEKSQAIPWCHQATCHYLSQCWPSFMASYGITGPWWVKSWLITVQIYHWYVHAYVYYQTDITVRLRHGQQQ